MISVTFVVTLCLIAKQGHCQDDYLMGGKKLVNSLCYLTTQSDYIEIWIWMINRVRKDAILYKGVGSKSASM